MNENEVRIGNLVTGDGDPYNRVCVIGIGEMDFIHLFNPIPITAEWLIKLGFKKTQSFGLEPAYWKADKEHTFEIEWDSKTGVDFICSGADIGLLFPHIKYVHQLQNLYFALTGTDLEIK
jgi:hypothetical protein